MTMTAPLTYLETLAALHEASRQCQAAEQSQDWLSLARWARELRDTAHLLHQLQVNQPLADMLAQVQLTAAEHNAFPGGRWL